MTTKLLAAAFLLSCSSFCIAQPGISADNPIKLCDLSDLRLEEFIPSIAPTGAIKSTCLNPGSQPGVWVEFMPSLSGRLAFIIDPFVQADDIDFIVFQRVETELKPIACMAQGLSYANSTIEEQSYCAGATGMNIGTTGTNQKVSGCQTAENFLPTVDCEKGVRYLIYIQNYESLNGALVTFSESSIKLDRTFGGCFEKSTTKLACTITPNPVEDFINLQVQQAGNDAINVSILDNRGVVLNQLNQLPYSIGSIIQIPVVSLPAGNYFVQVRNGSEMQTMSFSKF
jgi:hypothetical protein